MNEQHAESIRFLQSYVDEREAAGEIINANTWYLLAAAYVAQDDYESAREPMEKALQLHEEIVEAEDARRNSNFYSLLNAIYSQLGMTNAQRELLERMVRFFPTERSYRAQLEALETGNPLPVPDKPKPQFGSGFNSDRDAQPRVRIPPQYPAKCVLSERGVQLRVVILFDVTPEGRTENIRVKKVMTPASTTTQRLPSAAGNTRQSVCRANWFQDVMFKPLSFSFLRSRLKRKKAEKTERPALRRMLPACNRIIGLKRLFR